MASKQHESAVGDPQCVGVPILPTGIRFIEFFGLPGIGKTAASSVLAARLRQGGSIVDEKRTTWGSKPLIARQLRRARLVLPRLFDRKFRSLAVRTARFVAQGGQESPIDFVRWTWHLWSVAAYISEERSRGAPVTILDEGLMQGFWSVFLKSRHRRTSEHWLDILSAIGVDDFVFVNLCGVIDLAQDRLDGRGDRASRLQRAVPDDRVNLWINADRAYLMMAADLCGPPKATHRTPTVATVDVNPSMSPELVADKTLQAVHLAYHNRHHPADSQRR